MINVFHLLKVVEVYLDIMSSKALKILKENSSDKTEFVEELSDRGIKVTYIKNEKLYDDFLFMINDFVKNNKKGKFDLIETQIVAEDVFNGIFLDKFKGMDLNIRSISEIKEQQEDEEAAKTNKKRSLLLLIPVSSGYELLSDDFLRTLLEFNKYIVIIAPYHCKETWDLVTKDIDTKRIILYKRYNVKALNTDIEIPNLGDEIPYKYPAVVLEYNSKIGLLEPNLL